MRSAYAPQVGLEPTTTRLTAGCSAIELLRNKEGTGSDLSSRAVSSQVLSALESLTTVFGMGTGGTSPSLPPVKFSGWVSFFPFRSASFLSALRFASVLSRTLSLLLPASLRSVRFLPFRAFRSPCSVPVLSASFPFHFLPFRALRFPSFPLPGRSLRFRSVLQAVSSFALFSAP